MKKCSTCQKILARCEFRRDRHNPDGLMYHCKKCKSEKEKASHIKDPSIRKRINDRWKDKRKAYYSDESRKRKYKHEELLKTYGLTLEEYDKMHTEQNGVCAICSNPEKNKRLAIDHCHETGKIRALLCSLCNRGLGLFKDNKTLLTKAILYLENHDEK